MKKYVNGELVNLSNKEIANREKENQAHIKNLPFEKWKLEISAAHMDRTTEDIIDALDAPVRARLAPETKDRYDIKKEIRTRRPNTP